MAEQLLSPRQVAERLGFRRTRTYELLSSGALPLLRLNARVVRVREADLDRWIAAGCPMPSTEPSQPSNLTHAS